MAKCKVCGYRLSEGVTKCPMCGATVGSTVAGAISPSAKIKKSYCPSCHGEIIGEHRYCPTCGIDLKEAAKQSEGLTLQTSQIQNEKYCIQCGVKLGPNAKFCPECGIKQESQQIPNGYQTSKVTLQKQNFDDDEEDEYEEDDEEFIENNDIEISTDITQAMFNAIKRNDINSVTSVLNSGYKPNKRYNYITPLGFAAMFNTPQIAKLLIQRGATVKGLLCTCGQDNYNPLMMGVVNNSLETCKVLLDNGADVGAINIRSATALSIAKSRNLTEMIALLESYGAHKNSVRSVLFKGLMIGNVLGGTASGISAIARVASSEDDYYLKENW